MTTEEQFQSSEIQPVNGTEDVHANDHDDETSTVTSPSSQPVRRSRFFRSKRKQRLGQTGGDEESEHASNEPITSPTSPENEEEEEQQQITTSEISTDDTDSRVETHVHKRSISPPPPPPSQDDADDPSDTSSSNEDINAKCSVYSIKEFTPAKALPAQPRASLPTIQSGYTRKKSQSVKLTRIDPFDGDACPKKNVRFADDFGLDLSQIKMIKSDELPTVPTAAFKDLHVNDEEKTNMFEEKMKIITYLEQKFENPIHSHGFEDRVARHKVVLEQANAIDNRIYGTVKVVSFGINKRVKIRLTTNNWITFTDHETIYISDSYDGINDRFTFTIEIPRDRVCVGNNIQFCIGYESFVGPEYWDNNYQENYRFECTSRSIPDYSG